MGNRIEATGKVQAQAGSISTPDGSIANLGVTVGGQLAYKGARLNTDLTMGTALGGKVETGYTFDIGKNMGLDLSANAQYHKSLAGKNSVSFMNTALIQDESGIQMQQESASGVEWKPASLSFGGAAKLTKIIGSFKLSAGIEGGAYKSIRPSYEAQSRATLENKTTGEKTVQVASYSMPASKMKGYVGPTLGVEYNKGRVTGFAEWGTLNKEAGVRIRLGKK